MHPLPPLLHNRPERIAGEVRRTAAALLPAYRRVVVGYADCGTYGALDSVCGDLGLERLPGLHCYDVYAGADRVQAFFEEQPGTYLLTDFLVRSFARTVERELGLDRWPELREDYRHHRPNIERVVSQVASQGGQRVKLRYRGTINNHAWLKRRTAALNLRNLIGRGLTRIDRTWALAS